MWLLEIGYAFSFRHYKMFRKKKKTKKTQRVNQQTISNLAWFYIEALIVVGMWRWIYEVSLYGISLNNFFSIDSLAEANNLIAVARYSGGGVTNLLTQIGNIVIYAAPICGGYSFVYAKNFFQKVVSAASLLPEFLILLTNNTKAGFIGCLILWGAAYFIGYNEKNGGAPKINLKVFLTIGSLFIAFFGITFFSMMLRIGTISASTAKIVAQKYIVYACGQVQSFDVWLGHYYDAFAEKTLGQYTFFGVLNTLGIATREQGIYSSLPMTSSNVFTAFRGMIEDYGILLSFVIILITGYLVGILYSRQKMGGSSKVFLLSTYFFFIFGLFVSPWSYMSYIVAVLMFGPFDHLAKRKDIKVIL